MSFLWEKFVRPAMFRLDPERAHEFGIWALSKGLASPFYVDDSSFGDDPIERFGLKFANPIGLAAGFDKNGVAVEQLASFGFGFVEVGTVTYRPQTGNPKPRLFRLSEDAALVNRLGFNNEGAEAVSGRLRATPRRCVVGVNIGRNKDVPNEEAIENYLASFDLIHPAADYIAVNVSSPNTPGLRELQEATALGQLIEALTRRNRELGRKPLLVKVSPDLNDPAICDITDICLENAVSGIIATNTTVTRDGLTTTGAEGLEAGGLSGRPLAARSNAVISIIYRHSKGKLPVIGVGGVFTADDALAKIAAGASLIQAYTGFVYQGPDFARSVAEGLVKRLRDSGFSTLDEAIGSGTRKV
jgi:dihydroorotate dehydrogenase